MDAHQLTFPFAWEEVPLPAAGGGRLALQCRAWGLRLYLELLHSGGDGSASPSLQRLRSGRCERFELEVRVTRPAHASDRSRTPVLLVPGIDEAPDAVQLEITEFLGLIADAQRQHGPRRRPSELARAARLLQDGAAHLDRSCDPRALQRARGFASNRATRWFVYESVVNDASGRVTQMVDVCPGLLLMAKGLRDRGRTSCGDAILAAITHGEKLGRILERATESWAAWIEVAQPNVPRESVGVQRQRLRFAGKHVASDILLSPSLPGVIARDIPSDPVANARWYELTRLSLATTCDCDGPDAISPASLQALGRFLSRQGQTLETAWGKRGVGLRCALAEVVDYLRVTGRCPDRRTDPHKLLAEAQDWHCAATWEEEAGLPPKTALPVDTTTELRLGNDTLRPLATVGELIDESTRMHHCVASHARQAVSGAVQVFHAEVDGMALTVMTQRKGHHLEVVEARGVRNRPLSARERARVAALLARRASAS